MEIKGGNHREGVHVSFPNPLRQKSLVYVASELLSKPCAAAGAPRERYFVSSLLQLTGLISQVRSQCLNVLHTILPVLAAGGFSVLSSVLFALLFCARCEAGIHVLSFSTYVYAIPTSLTRTVISSYTQMLGFCGSHIHNSFIMCLCLWPCSSQGVLPSLAGRIPSGNQLSVYSSSANGTATARKSGEAAFQHSGVACFAWVDILFFNYFRSHVFVLSEWIRIFSRIYVQHLHFLFMPVNKIRALSNKLTFPMSTYIFSFLMLVKKAFTFRNTGTREVCWCTLVIPAHGNRGRRMRY